MDKFTFYKHMFSFEGNNVAVTYVESANSTQLAVQYIDGKIETKVLENKLTREEFVSLVKTLTDKQI